MSNPLASSVALVTGGASGLGTAFARKLAHSGMQVVIADIAIEKAEAVAQEIDGWSVACDVTQSAQVNNAVAKTVEKYGRIDVLINNAGIAPEPDHERFATVVANQMLRFEGRISEMTPVNVISELPDEEWDKMMKIHLYGAFYGCRAAAHYMTVQRSGSIINVSSVLGLRPSPMAPHYSAAKAAIIALTKSVAGELAPFGVRVNAICPGYIDTPLLAPMDDLMRTAIVSQIGMGRFGEAEEIAELVAYLASPQSSYSTGEVLSASGGYGL